MPWNKETLRQAPGYLARHAFGLGSWAAVLAILVLPRRWALEGPRVCLWHRLSGIPCPGCGLTRSLWLAAHGEIWPSLFWHPLGPALLLLLLVWGLDSFPLHRPAWKRFLIHSQSWFFAALVVTWVVRLSLGQTTGL